MAKPRGVNQKARYRAQRLRLAKYSDMVQSVYDTLSLEVANIVASTGYDGSKPFRFSDFPETRKAFEKVQSSFVRDIRSVIYTGTSAEWKESNLVQDLLADKALKFYGSKAGGKKHKVYYQTNSDALRAFQHRKDNGMNLSQKLWNQSKNYKQEMEYAISSAIEKGTSAVTLSKRLSKYLNDFPQLKKDYKDKYGKAVKCQDCEYRSMRLARNEINMAYRKAEQERWMQFDFVLGKEIKTTQNGKHEVDICDQLAGRYPKDFDWAGWHANCMCYEIPILMSEEQFWGNEEAEPISDTPEGFKRYLSENNDRIEAAKDRGTLTYWYEDNQKYVEYELAQQTKDGLVDVVVPSFTKKSVNFGTDAVSVMDQIDAYMGTAGIPHYNKDIDLIKGSLDSRIRNGHDVSDTLIKFNDLVHSDFGGPWRSIDHLNEMARATDLSMIPSQWRGEFNRYMDFIRNYDIEKNGYGGVYKQIEGAYNIYKLSTDPDAIAYGLSRLSEKTPWNLFDTFREKGISLNYLPDDELFRYKGDFIPWYDKALKMGESFTIRDGAYYDSTYDHVVINRAYFDQSTGRVAHNTYEIPMTFYHEYGHAFDERFGWRKEKSVVDLFDKYSTKYDSMPINDIKLSLDLTRSKIDASSNSSNDFNRTRTQYSIVSDVIQAIRKDHAKIYGGHSDNYYMFVYKSGNILQLTTMQLKEFVAHMSEIYWLPNEFWKEFDPKMYSELKAIMSILYKRM